jgi:ParB family chromosome partitioning protein
VIVDLFQEQHGVTDPALLKKVADDKLAAIAEIHAQDGFAWSLMEDALPGEWHAWKRLRLDAPKPGREHAKALKDLQAQIDDQNGTAESRRAARVELARLSDRLLIESMTPQQRAKSGVVLSLNGDGGVTQTIGVQRPKEDAPKILVVDASGAKAGVAEFESARAKAKAAAEEVTPTLSLKAQSQRAVELTAAAAQVLEKHPALGLIVLVAGFADRGGYGAIRAKVEGSGANALQLMQTDDIAQNVKKLRGMKAPVLQKLVGQAAAASLVFQAHSAERAAIEDKGVAAIIALLPPKDLAAALKRVFDPEDYFGKGLPKELALEAIRENCGQNVFEDQRAVHSATDLRAFALANIKDDWLPPELRFPGYAGPGAKKKIQPAKATKKAKR